jgi:hypothetical protein
MSFYTQFFIRPYKHPLVQPPAGSFLMDENGGIQSCTLPTSYPRQRLRTIADKVFRVFKEAQRVQIEFNELRVDYPGLSLRAKRGPRGTMVYLTPPTPEEEATLPS